jgi:hypothetical protein
VPLSVSPTPCQPASKTICGSQTPVFRRDAGPPDHDQRTRRAASQTVPFQLLYRGTSLRDAESGPGARPRDTKAFVVTSLDIGTHPCLDTVGVHSGDPAMCAERRVLEDGMRKPMCSVLVLDRSGTASSPRAHSGRCRGGSGAGEAGDLPHGRRRPTASLHRGSRLHRGTLGLHREAWRPVGAQHACIGATQCALRAEYERSDARSAWRPQIDPGRTHRCTGSALGRLWEESSGANHSNH